MGFSGAYIKRIRISPDERYLATSLQSENSEEATCVIMKLGDIPLVEEVIPNVFSFGKLFIDIPWFTPTSSTTLFSVYK